MIVRNPSKPEVQRAAEVAALAFPNLSLEHWMNSFNMVAEVFGTRYILVVEDGGQLVSTLLCQPMPVYINGSPVPHASAGAVATIPDARCKGCAGAMMAETVRLLRSEGVCLSSLWPFSYEYYRKFGWEIGSEVRGYGAPGEVFAKLGDASRAREAGNGDLARVKLVYDEWASNYNCLTQRSDKWWDRVLGVREPLKTDTHAMVLHMTDGRIDGYAGYQISGEADNRSIDVNEIAFTQAQDRRDMLALLGSMVPDGRVGFHAPMNDMFLQELPNPRLVSTAVNASFQFRVIDPPKAMQCLELDEDVSGRATFSISDPVFKEGWEFGVIVEDGEVSLTKPDPRRKLEMDVQTFARFYSGYLTPYDAWELGKVKVTGDAMEMLLSACELFSPLTPYRTGMEPG